MKRAKFTILIALVLSITVGLLIVAPARNEIIGQYYNRVPKQAVLWLLNDTDDIKSNELILSESLNSDDAEIKSAGLSAVQRIIEKHGPDSPILLSFMAENLNTSSIELAHLAVKVFENQKTLKKGPTRKLLWHLNHGSDSAAAHRATRILIHSAKNQSVFISQSLSPLLKRPEATHKTLACLLIGELKLERHVLYLIAMLEDENADIRQVASQSLGILGKMAGIALPYLKKLEHDSSELVKQVAYTAIRQIEEESKSSVPTD